MSESALRKSGIISSSLDKETRQLRLPRSSAFVASILIAYRV